MCYDIALFTSIELASKYLPELKESFTKQRKIEFEPVDHRLAQSYEPWPVIFKENGDLKERMFEWCVIADYMDTPNKIMQLRPKMGNARSEKILLKSSYWNRIRHQRCIIPVNGFYEHRHVARYDFGIPYYIIKKDQPLFFLACLYAYAQNENGEQVGTFAVVMLDANDKIKTIHNYGDNAFRQPLILQNSMIEAWLDPTLSDRQLGKLLKYQITSEEVDAWPVFSVRADMKRPDGKKKYEPFEYSGLQPLGTDTLNPETIQPSLF